MPNLPEILGRLQFIGPEALLLGLFITGGTILVARDWRFLILALLAQYVLVGLFLTRLVRTDIAVLTVLVGAFICPILFLSARQVSISLPTIYDLERRPPVPGDGWQPWWRNFSVKSFFMGTSRVRRLAATGLGFRVFVGLLVVLVTLSLSRSFPLPDLPSTVTTAVYWLVLAGLVTLTLTEDPMKAGHGLFSTLSGFGLFYITLESSLLLTGLWGTVSLLIALAIGYLTVVRGASPEEEI